MRTARVPTGSRPWMVVGDPGKRAGCVRREENLDDLFSLGPSACAPRHARMPVGVRSEGVSSGLPGYLGAPFFLKVH